MHDKYATILNKLHEQISESGLVLKSEGECFNQHDNIGFKDVEVCTKVTFTIIANELKTMYKQVTYALNKRMIIYGPSEPDKNKPLVKYYINKGRNAKTHTIIPASAEDLKKYNSFIAELNSIPGLNKLEKLAIAYDTLHNNMQQTKFNPEEALEHSSMIPQISYAPATIFSGTKRGVCFDNSIALCDIGIRTGTHIDFVMGEIDDASKEIFERLYGKPERFRHAWNRVNIFTRHQDLESLPQEFDLDITWSDVFNMLSPRKDTKRKIDYSKYANIHIPDTMNSIDG